MVNCDIFRCPISRRPLRPLSAQELGQVGSELASGVRVHASGQKAEGSVLSSAIGTDDLRYVYRVDDDIFALLPQLALVASSDATVAGLDADRQVVQSFYDEFGCAKNERGVY